MNLVIKTGRLRWLSVVLLLVAGTVGIIISNRVSPSDPNIALVVGSGTASEMAMPSVAGDTPASSWFCPGVPGRDDTVSSEIIVANPTKMPITGTLTLLSTDKPAFTTTVVVAPLVRGIFDATGGRKSQYISAIVELDSQRRRPVLITRFISLHPQVLELDVSFQK